jgi:hypothetical protein
MGARRKLNRAHLAGALGLAALTGLASGSWTVFAVAGTVLIVTSLANGEIRFRKGGRR